MVFLLILLKKAVIVFITLFLSKVVDNIKKMEPEIIPKRIMLATK